MRAIDRVDPIVEAFVVAATAGDEVRLHTLVDWPTTGVARYVASLGELSGSQRVRLARSGMVEMLALAEGDGIGRPLGGLARRLATEPRVIRLDAAGVGAFVEAARPGPLPAGVPVDIVEFVDRLRGRISGIAEAYRVTDRDRDSIGLGVLPDGGRLTLVRRFGA